MKMIRPGFPSTLAQREAALRMSFSQLPVRLLVVALATSTLAFGAVASAQAAAPAWTIVSAHAPSTFQRLDQADGFVVTVTNSGDADTTGDITVTDTLPAGLEVRTLGVGGSFSCPSVADINAGAPLTCTQSDPIEAGGSVQAISVQGVVASDAPNPMTNAVTIAGGGAAAAASSSDPVTVVDQPAFGAIDFIARSLDLNGDDYTVAGGHPYEATTSFAFPTYVPSNGNVADPVEDVKDIYTQLPPGFVGDASAASRCPLAKLAPFVPQCPPSSVVGTITLSTRGLASPPSPIFNLVPEKGYPAEFGFKAFGNAVVMYPQLRSRTGDYGLTVTVPGASRLGITGIALTFFGVPSALNGAGGPPIPFLSNQSDCLVAQPTTKITVDSWQHPARKLADGFPDMSDPNWKTHTAPAPPVTGCDSPALASQFQPTISVGPTPGSGTTQADEPSGYSVGLAFAQSNDPTDPTTVFDPSLPATPPLKDATVTLPGGVAVSPSAADGLEGCSDSGAEDQVHYDSTLPVSCPDASKIGSVVARPPVLAAHDPQTDAVTGAEPIDGDVFLIKPHNGDLSLAGDQDGTFRVLIQLESERYGLNVKLPGIVTADKDTGRLTARFTGNPQLPVKALEITFKGGERAPLANPSTCTTDATTTGMFTPWSRGGIRSDGLTVPGGADVTASSTFAIDQGANGAPCASSEAELPFNPGFSAGVQDAQAATSSPFTLRFTRQDGEQELGSIDATLPAGLLASIGAVPLCPEDQAAAGTCSAASQIGSTTVGAGAGPSPLFLPQAGKDPTAVYLAGPYEGAPLSLSIVVPAEAGPFDLGTVVVRAALLIDPHDAQVTVKSDPLPRILDGIPLRLRDVRVNIDRPGFMLSPSNCKQQALSAQINSADGKSANVSSPFAVSGCSSLRFQPRISASTSGKTSKANGASLVVKLAQGPGEAGISKVDLTLPVALPSRLTTLQKACTEAQFAANPAGCPEGSVVGSATARTPLLQTPLTGPAYLVSHGGAAFPDVVFMLQANERGALIRIDLTGSTQISKGITYSRFDTVPDAPIQSFQATLPQGPHSVFGANGDFCQKAPLLFSEIVAQNGALVTQSTKIAVTGCPKAPSLKLKSHKVAHRAVTLAVSVPAAGRLTASGNGLTVASKQVRGAGTVKLVLRAKRHGKLSTKIKLRFAPEVGEALSAGLRLRFRG